MHGIFFFLQKGTVITFSYIAYIESMENFAFQGKEKFYFIGIGGISMSGLASYLAELGYSVKGSDLFDSEQVERLRLKGVDVAVGEGVSLRRVEWADIVVYTDALSLENKELEHAFLRKKIVYSRVEFLRRICRQFSKVIAVGGSHGKTTCTSMCAHVLSAANAAFTAHIGGMDSRFGNFVFLGNDYFVTEACEYKKNLLKLSADVAILLNVDFDHMECYDGEEDVVNTFRAFACQAKLAIVCGDDERCRAIDGGVTFAIKNRFADYRAVQLRAERERYSFTVLEYGRRLCRVKLKAVGRCHVYNALAAFAAMRSLGFSASAIKTGLESFVAVKRRFEEIGTLYGATVICDYAHHPREIVATVETARKTCSGRVYVVFQPHTYSRTMALMEEFIMALRPLKRLTIYKTYAAREKYDEAGDGKTLAERVGNCLYADNLAALGEWLRRTVRENDCILFLGAGDIYFAAWYLVKGTVLVKK